MKKGGKIALGAVAVLAVAGVAVAAWQWNNLNALRYGLTLSQADIDEKLAENEQTLTGAMEEYHVRSYEFSEEELRPVGRGDPLRGGRGQKAH